MSYFLLIYQLIFQCKITFKISIKIIKIYYWLCLFVQNSRLRNHFIFWILYILTWASPSLSVHMSFKIHFLNSLDIGLYYREFAITWGTYIILMTSHAYSAIKRWEDGVILLLVLSGHILLFLFLIVDTEFWYFVWYLQWDKGFAFYSCDFRALICKFFYLFIEFVTFKIRHRLDFKLFLILMINSTHFINHGFQLQIFNLQRHNFGL